MLYNVPPPLPFEGVASWLSQVAASQVANPADVLSYLGISLRQDLDLVCKTKQRVASIAALCRLEPRAFEFIRRMTKNLARVDRESTYLLQHGELARYRFCPQCLRRQRTPYFPLHWRFAAYRWCEEHKQLLQDRCPSCHAPVVMPLNLLHAAEKGRRPEMHWCMACGQKLTSKPRHPGRFAGTRNFLNTNEWRLLQNGKATLAALYHGYVRVAPSEVVRPLRTLVALERAGHIPNFQLRYETLETQRTSYRHPYHGRLVPLSRTRATVLRGGLFD